MPLHIHITPVLLAAGASARMGRPKALLDFDGRTCLDLALDAVRGLGTPIVVLGAARAAIEPRIPPGAARVVWNPDHALGQTSSLQCALAALPPDADAFTIHPIDLPLVRAVDVARLVDAFLAHPDPRVAIFIPSHARRRGHPVLCHRALAAEFAALPPDAPARAVIHADPARIAHVEFDRDFVLMDMDTPDDYAECLHTYRAREQK